MIPDRVREWTLQLPPDERGLPAYVYDLAALRAEAAGIRAALAASGTEFFYAAKANPAPEILGALEPYVDGFEVASGGELAHVRGVLPAARIAFGGPGKTDRELEVALTLGVERIHVESPSELDRLAALAPAVPLTPAPAGSDPAGANPAGSNPAGANPAGLGVLLRANLDLSVAGAALQMSGPFGMDERGLAECLARLEGAPNLRLCGVHTHLASGLDAGAMLGLADGILAWARPWLREHAPGLDRPEVVLGGGMAVDYAAPEARFDWAAYGRGLEERAGEVRLRVEPGRSVSVHCGYYVTDVLDVKWTHGRAFAVLRGGTHHLRTPATKGHDQPFTIVSRGGPGPGLTSDDATLVGQLCTPKDVLAAHARIEDLRVGDLVVFEMAGAYAWNISHHDFLMHPHPGFHWLE